MFDSQDGKAWTATYESGADALAEHEERAENTMWFAYATALVGVVVLVMAHRRPADDPIHWAFIAVLLLGAVLTAVGMAYVANAGGEIMHREIRGDGLSTVK